MSGSVDDFERGLVAAFDPQPDRAEAADGEAVTNVTSWWHHEWCETCGHTFRRGDRVLVDSAARRARHLAPSLGCAGPAGSSQAGAEVAEFTDGLLTTWPVVGDLPVRRTDDEPHLLHPPVGTLRRAVCLFCAHTFRPGEHVVICPCLPFERRCHNAVHRDPALGLVCWESWRPTGGLEICPILLHRLTP